MSPWGIATATGVIVVVGSWARVATYNKGSSSGPKPPGLTAKQAGAAVFYIFVILGLDAANEELAAGFAGLVLLTAILEYGVPIAQNMGLVK